MPDPAATVELLASLDAIACDRGDVGLSGAVRATCDAVVVGARAPRDVLWPVVDACMAQLGGELAARSPLIDESGNEWSDAVVEAAHDLIEEAT